jgi:hypothetical protein
MISCKKLMDFFKEESTMQKSRHGLNSVLPFLVLIFIICLPSISTAMWLDGPNPVRANSDGSFYAATSIHATQGGNDISTITLTGTVNCFEVKSNDHECLLHIPYGEFHTEGFNMWLVDTEVPAVVVFTVVNCTGLTLEYEIDVLPSTYVATFSESWGSIKACYR